MNRKYQKPLLQTPNDSNRFQNSSSRKRKYEEPEKEENFPMKEAWESRRPQIKLLLEEKDRELNRLKVQLHWNRAAMKRGKETILKLQNERSKLLKIPARLEQEYNEALEMLAKGKDYKKPKMNVDEKIDEEGLGALNKEIENTEKLQFIPEKEKGIEDLFDYDAEEDMSNFYKTFITNS